MTKYKMIRVISIGLRGERERCFYNGTLAVNNGTRGILFSGHDSPGNNNGKLGESKYLPFDLIRSVEVEEYDGGMVICNNPAFLQIALDVANVYEWEGIEI